MTNEEYNEAQNQLVAADTEIAALEQTERECIQQARRYNDARKQATASRVALQERVAPLRQIVAEYQRELKQQQLAKMQEEAAAAPKQPDQLAMLTEQVAKLTAMLEAKKE
jgi:ribosomal protein S15P/S13E